MPEQTESWVHLARIRHPQGRKGEVFADILTDFPEKFAERKQLWLLAGSAATKPKSDSHSSHGKASIRQEVSSSHGKDSDRQEAPLSHDKASVRHEVSGHSFSRAVQSAKKSGALAPEGTGISVKGTGFSPYIKSDQTTGALAPEGRPPREVELIHHWPHKGGIILHFAGIESISAAETLKGLLVSIPSTERAALADDEVYIADLIGCLLIDITGAEPVTVGEIEEVDRNAGPVALLVVQGASGEVLIPFAKSYLRNINIKAKRVEMALPEGLVDLNAPGKTP